MHNAKVISYDDDYDDDDYDDEDEDEDDDDYHHYDNHDLLFFSQMAAKDKEIEDLKYRVVEVQSQKPTYGLTYFNLAWPNLTNCKLFLPN